MLIVFCWNCTVFYEYGNKVCLNLKFEFEWLGAEQALYEAVMTQIKSTNQATIIGIWKCFKTPNKY